jgi:acyl carrier protein phosphodiesterase
MNYLAHFYLSDQTPQGFVGSILGDFVRGNFVGKFTQIIEYEIQMHRKIDSFTDVHSIVKQSKRRVSANRGKLAGVLVDMFYDHFFAVNFETYSNIPLKEFSAEVYQALHAQQEFLPEDFRRKITAIADFDLLGSYITLDGIGLALYRISKRLKRENNLSEGIFDLKNNYNELSKDFAAFFPELIEFVENQRKITVI